MKTTIDIPDALFRKAKIRAAERGVTLKSLLIDALERGVAGAAGVVGVVEEAPTIYPASPTSRPALYPKSGGKAAAPVRSPAPRKADKDLGFTVNEYGVPVLNRKPGDKSVITNEMIRRMRDDEGV